jgi:hypothetical protein
LAQSIDVDARAFRRGGRGLIHGVFSIQRASACMAHSMGRMTMKKTSV